MLGYIIKPVLWWSPAMRYLTGNSSCRQLVQLFQS